MNKIIAMLMTIFLWTSQYEWAMDMAWNNATDEQRYYMSTEYKARACGMSQEEFEFFARVVEAESDRSDSVEGRIMIAIVILNRVECEQFPDTITEVLRQSGQFEVVVNGDCTIDSTLLSEWAIVEAIRTIDEYPHDLVYFNCISFSDWNIDYALVDGNYFSRSGCNC